MLPLHCALQLCTMADCRIFQSVKHTIFLKIQCSKCTNTSPPRDMTGNNLYYNDENSNGYVLDFFMVVERERIIEKQDLYQQLVWRPLENMHTHVDTSMKIHSLFFLSPTHASDLRLSSKIRGWRLYKRDASSEKCKSKENRVVSHGQSAKITLGWSEQEKTNTQQQKSCLFTAVKWSV